MTTSQTTAAVSNPRPSSQWLITLVGVALLIIGCFLSWSYVPALLGNLSVNFFPGAIQIFMIIVGVLGLFFLLLRKGLFPGAHKLLDSARGLRALSVTAAAFMVLVVSVIGLQAPGLANADPGVFVTLVGALAMVAGSFRMPSDPTVDPITVHLPSWVEILVIVAMLTVVLFGAAYALGQEDGTVFSLFLLFLAGLVVALARAGLFSWFGVIAQRNRRVIMLGAFAVAFLFPFTQNGSDANMSIATQVIIFATTALGLNIVVGLAGLLDLGYIAFLGAGAYVGAIVFVTAGLDRGHRLRVMGRRRARDVDGVHGLAHLLDGGEGAGKVHPRGELRTPRRVARAHCGGADPARARAARRHEPLADEVGPDDPDIHALSSLDLDVMRTTLAIQPTMRYMSAAGDIASFMRGPGPDSRR